MAENSETLLIRSYRPPDKSGVKSVLLEGVYTNLWPSYMKVLNKYSTKLFGGFIFTVSMAMTGNLITAGLSLLAYLIVLYGFIWCAGLIYFYISCSDINDVAKHYFTNSDSHFWVAEYRGEIVGTVAIVPKEYIIKINKHINGTTSLGKTAFLRRMAVSKKCRKLGIGYKLIDATERFCRKNNYDSIQLITTEMQEPARRLYVKYGFIDRGCKPYNYKMGISVVTHDLILPLDK